MIDNGEYNIKPDIDYNSLQKEAENKLFINVDREAKRLRDYFILFVLSLVMISTCLLVDTNRYENAIVNKDITAYLGGIGATFLVYIGLLFLLLAAAGIFKGIRRIKLLVEVYKTDLKRAEEKLEDCGIYVSIPEEDTNKYNNVLSLVLNSLKNRKKILEK